MNKTIFLLLAVLGPFCANAQQFLWENTSLPDFKNVDAKRVLQRNTEFYVVDSLYCHQFDHASQMHLPTTRQYNLAFDDETGDALETRTETYNIAAGVWENAFRETFTFDDGHNLIEQTKQSWDDNQQSWVNDRKTTNTPNAHGDFTSVLNQTWHLPASAWRNLDRLKLEYNPNGHIQTIEQETWDTLAGSWQKVFKIVYGVTQNGQVGASVFQLYLNGGWKIISKETYSFDPDHPQLETERLAEVWNDALLTWVKSSRTLKEYAPNGNLTTETFQLWNAPDSTWLNQSRYLRNYNGNGDVTLKTDLTWNGSQWVNFFQTKNTYDAVFNLTRFEVFQWVQNEWAPLNSCDFYWRFHHETVAATEHFLEGCHFPNPYLLNTVVPCEELLEIQDARLFLYDLSGKLMLSENFANRNFLNIARPIPAGMYVLRISGRAGSHFTKKIVITSN